MTVTDFYDDDSQRHGRSDGLMDWLKKFNSKGLSNFAEEEETEEDE